jgi:hypothetical protein
VAHAQKYISVLENKTSGMLCCAVSDQLWHSRLFGSVSDGRGSHKYIRIRVTLRLAVYRQSVRLCDKPLETHDQYFFQLNTSFHSPYVKSSLKRGWFYSLQFLLALDSAVILRSDFRGIHYNILLFQFWDSPNLEDQVPVFICPRKRVARSYPQALGSTKMSLHIQEWHSLRIQL